LLEQFVDESHVQQFGRLAASGLLAMALMSAVPAIRFEQLPAAQTPASSSRAHGPF
jgi:hypothetical protein